MILLLSFYLCIVYSYILRMLSELWWFLIISFLVRRTRRKTRNGQPVKGHPIFVEGSDHVGVDAVAETSRKYTRRGRPRKTKVFHAMMKSSRSC